MTVAYGGSVVTDNLVMLLDAANSRSYPGSGTVWYDMSGNSNTGVITGSPTYSSSNLGYFTFNGSAQYVTTPLVQTSITAYSISVWFNTTSSTQYMTMVGDRGSGSGSLFVCVNSNGFIVPIYTAATYNDGKWHNVVGVFNQSSGSITYSSFTLYVDGILASTSNGTLVGSGSSPITGLGGTVIGSSQAAVSGVYYTGSMSAVQIYNRALSAAQIAQNFNAYRGRYGI